MSSRSRIAGLLLDIDGTLLVSRQPVPGAASTVGWLRERRLPFRFVTNTTTQSRKDLAAALSGAGIEVDAAEILTAVAATAGYLRSHHPNARVLLLSDAESIRDLEGVQLTEQEDADVVVIGGASELFTYSNLNRAFRAVMDGAALVGMHRSLYWRAASGLQMDGGAFLRALEEASGREAVVCGKPAAAFFEEAARAVGQAPERLAMIGDDVRADVLAAQGAGLTGVLVRTGKFRPEDLDRGDVDHVIDSVADLPDLLSAA